MLALLFLCSLPLAFASDQRLGLAIGGALDSWHAATATAPPSSLAAEATTGPLTISVYNHAKHAVTPVYGSNAGVPSPISAPTATVAPGKKFKFVAPSGWAGRITVGYNTNPNGSKIEASFTGPPNIDVSYVDGYSLPIVCSCDGRGIVTGCNKDLFGLNKCPDQVAGPVCTNPTRFMNDGPPSTFFAPCQGAAYTFPNDNSADTGCASHTISCCIGGSCRPNPKQPA